MFETTLLGINLWYESEIEKFGWMVMYATNNTSVPQSVRVN